MLKHENTRGTRFQTAAVRSKIVQRCQQCVLYGQQRRARPRRTCAETDRRGPRAANDLKHRSQPRVRAESFCRRNQPSNTIRQCYEAAAGPGAPSFLPVCPSLAHPSPLTRPAGPAARPALKAPCKEKLCQPMVRCRALVGACVAGLRSTALDCARLCSTVAAKSRRVLACRSAIG